MISDVWAPPVAQQAKSASSVGDLGSTSGLERCPGEENSYPLQDSGLENSMDYTVHGVAESDTIETLSLSLHFNPQNLKS